MNRNIYFGETKPLTRSYNPCSWCLQEMNLKPEPGSHGICRRHKAQLEAEALRLRNIYAVEDAIRREG